MCTTYFSTYVNCHHRPFRRTGCALYTQDHRTCTGKVEVHTKGGLICPACFDRIVWVRSNGEWETIETPEGDLAKDDWEQVERVGYDWKEDKKSKDLEVGVKGNSRNALIVKEGTEQANDRVDL
ncbi:a9ca8de1-7e24-4968-a9a5-d01f7a8969b4-CDS [Sclerotinia trifoliorum]|uniref:A9ca8de1-7e24-4968-a9a5-d01f7a8969b4-CDS n=1 Tax=Sclerotinia trifoliorum TaxID=28548 RepID=A0A8H2ZPU4_9HELO|nr:a9ca8de1-7e24-4968-a9a5-d01f7a8969b4-CDS [Sclerotinia trifoliorum]